MVNTRPLEREGAVEDRCPRTDVRDSLGSPRPAHDAVKAGDKGVLLATPRTPYSGSLAQLVAVPPPSPRSASNTLSSQKSPCVTTESTSSRRSATIAFQTSSTDQPSCCAPKSSASTTPA